MKKITPPCKNCITLAICVGKVRVLKEEFQFESRTSAGSIYLTLDDYDDFKFQVEMELKRECELLDEYFDMNWDTPDDIRDEKINNFEEVFKDDYPDYSDGEKLYYGKNGKAKKGKLVIDAGCVIRDPILE